jgi:tRNA-(ms[2]io[6]A)-hydroxylase
MGRRRVEEREFGLGGAPPRRGERAHHPKSEADPARHAPSSAGRVAELRAFLYAELSMPPNRRLPVLQESAAPDDGRPAWHWVFIGALFALSIWLPLSMLGLWVASRLWNLVEPPPSAEGLNRFDWHVVAGMASIHLLGFALACLASGALVGRFGNRAGVREAVQGCVLAGAIAALGAALLGAGGGSALASLLILGLVGGAAGLGGGRLGWARRPLAERRPRR